MREGWHNEDYLVLLSEEESSAASKGYRIGEYLPGYQILGLRGWDDFIVCDAEGSVYTVPTVPLVSEYVSLWTMPAEATSLEPDSRFTGKIKWYTKPIVFGGDPSAPSNTLWIPQDVHMELVCWWNTLYRDVGAGSDVRFLEQKHEYFDVLCRKLGLETGFQEGGKGYAIVSAGAGNVRIFFEHEHGLCAFAVGGFDDTRALCGAEELASRFPRIRMMPEGQQRLDLAEQRQFIEDRWANLQVMFSPDHIAETRAWHRAAAAAQLEKYSRKT